MLTKEGIWHLVIKDKYLPHCSVVTWFRTTNNTARAASQTWKNLVKSVNLITHWLCWNPGFGHSVIVGKDCILGLGNTSFLSPQLITSLNFNILDTFTKQEVPTGLGFYQSVGKPVMKSDSLETWHWNGTATARCSRDLECSYKT